MTTTLILGAGFIGTRLARDLPGAELSTVDITDAAAVEREIAKAGARAVVNAAGKTGRPNVDWCETHQLETYRANVTGAFNVAEACARRGVFLLHLGSGCVFYGAAPSRADGAWREDDDANPISFYSRTKYAADLVLSKLPNVCVARLRMPVDDTPSPRNLITKLASYRDVIDASNSVTVLKDLVGVVARLLELRAPRATGVFHVTNPGVLRHTELLALYRELVDETHAYRLIAPEDLVPRGLALRPRSNCVLASPRLESLGIAMREVHAALRETMTSYARARTGVLSTVGSV